MLISAATLAQLLALCVLYRIVARFIVSRGVLLHDSDLVLSPSLRQILLLDAFVRPTHGYLLDFESIRI